MTTEEHDLCIFLQLNTGDIYKGLTDELPRRLQAHHDGRVIFTKRYLPARLIGYEA